MVSAEHFDFAQKKTEFAERHFPKAELCSGDEVCELFYPLLLQGQVG